jgi:hypothetical protein
MKVSDDQVASVYAYVTGNVEEFDRISDSLPPVDRKARGTLVTAAFFRAADQRFSGGDTRPAIIDFVSTLRARSPEVADAIDPKIAERLILAAVSDEEIDDIDGETQGTHFWLLLARLVADRQYSDAELNLFLADARQLADNWLEQP